MTSILSITAREILDSRGNPTIEVTIKTKTHQASASVPSGASTGTHEALELRDHNNRYGGKGVQKAIKNINKIIFPLLKNQDCTKQELLDRLMIKADNTKNKSRLGANAILAVSLACARLAAKEQHLPLYKYLNKITKNKPKLPQPFFNVLNGGKHAGTNFPFQEFMIVPQTNNFKEALKKVKSSITNDDLAKYQNIEEEYLRTARGAAIRRDTETNYFG